MTNRLIPLLLIIFCCKTTFAQLAVMHDAVSGRPYMIKALEDVEGTPYLFENWATGTVRFKNGGIVKDKKLKYDIYNNKLFYNQNDSLFEFVSEVEEFRLQNPKSSGNAEELIFTSINALQKDKIVFGQILAKGKLSLIKFHNKVVQETSNYNASKTRVLVNKSSTFLVINEDMRPAKYSKEQLEDLAADKKAELFAFINSNKLNLKKEQDFISAIIYYNSLFAK
jgi:hypothetical protein